MEKFRNALITRLAILLEFEPCDAVQGGYFQYLDELRGGTVGENAQCAAVRDGARIVRKVTASA